MKRYALSPAQRIRDSRDFARIFDRKQRAADRLLLVFAAANSLGRTRMGLSVSRKFGCAANRAAVKRLLREAFRLSQHELPKGLDLILIPQKQSGSAGRLADYRKSLLQLTQRLSRRIAARRSPS